MRKIISRVPVAGLALLLVLSGCDKRRDSADLPAGSDSSRQGQAMVRVVNAVPDVPAINVFADDENTFTAVDFKTVTNYQAVNDNFVTFTLKKADATATDSTEPVARNREMLDDGDRYTIVIIPGEKIEDNPKLMVLEEPNDSTDSGKVRIRVVNAARALGKVDVFIPGEQDPFLADVNFDSEAGYKDIDAQKAPFQVRVNDSPRVLLDIPSQSWEAGHSYTVIVTNKGTTGKGLEAIVIEDEVGGDS